MKINKVVIDWKPVVGYEGLYEISNTGLLRSCERQEWVESCRTGGHFRKRKATLISGGSAGDYKLYQLSRDGKVTGYLAHRLVATHFVENPEGNPEVNHIDEDKSNNNATNLEWVTRSGNAIHSVDKFKGENSGTAKLTEVDVLEIVEHLRKGVSQVRIAEVYGVTPHTIHKIKVGKNWGWLTGLDKEGSCDDYS